MSNEGLHYNADGSHRASIGHDAVSCHRVATIISGLRMSIKTNGKMILTRGATPTRLMKMATQYTGQKYKQTEKQRCINDLKVWLETMKLALPVHIRGE